MRKCTKCGTEITGGYKTTGMCSRCFNDYRNERRKADPDKYRSYSREWRRRVAERLATEEVNAELTKKDREIERLKAELAKKDKLLDQLAARTEVSQPESDDSVPF